MSYLRGANYVWRDDERVHFWCADGTDGSADSCWALTHAPSDAGIVRLAAICSQTLMASGHATAQRVNAISIAAGSTPIVQNALAFPYKTGVNAQFSLDLVRVFGRLGVRADVYIDSFARSTAGTTRARRTSIPGAAASFLLPLTHRGARLQPYILAGAGTYRTDLGQGNTQSHFEYGVGGGLEVQRGPVRPFIEVRTLRIIDGGTPRTLPMMFGLPY